MPDDAPDIDKALLTQWTSSLDQLEGPLTDEEAVALLSCFPPDDGTVFGLAWSLLHAIESAPYGPTFIRELDDRSWWVTLLKQRAVRAGVDVSHPQLPLLSNTRPSFQVIAPARFRQRRPDDVAGGRDDPSGGLGGRTHARQ